MSNRYIGGVLSATPPTVNLGEASGIWTPSQQGVYQAAGTWPVVPFPVSRSLRFNSADSAYLNRTPASAGNRKTWTWSGWVKRSELGTVQIFTSCYSASNDSSNMDIGFYSDNTLRVVAWTTTYRTTTQVFRDPSSWYHIIIAVDTTQATANDRVRLYVNGLEITVFTTTNNPSQNADIGYNQAATTRIGSSSNAVGNLCNLYLTEIHFIDGQALTPSSFGATNAITGVWSPIEYTGSYGTNGFYLNFSDNTSTTTLGEDQAGSNDWTLNNFSVTAGTGNDSLVDTPTPYGTDTGAGGEVRGNYCTLNPLNQTTNLSTVSQGNLYGRTTATSGYFRIGGTIFVSSGKWYYEYTPTELGLIIAGVATNKDMLNANPGSAGVYKWGYYNTGTKFGPGVFNTAYGASYTVNDVIGVAMDMDAGTLTFYKNGVSQGTAFTDLSGYEVSAVMDLTGFGGGTNTGAAFFNFGQRPFAYTAPSGFKALCTQNLPIPTVVQGDDYFNTVLYTGNGSTQSITGVGFQPDYVWIKKRTTGGGNTAINVFDAVRGAGKPLFTSSTSAELTGRLTAFDSDGFTVDSDNAVNDNSQPLVAWNWNAGGSNATNTDGTITSTVRANPTAGFSVVTWTGVANGTVGHGLGVSPELIIAKSRTQGSYDWVVYHKSLGNGQYIALNSIAGALSYTNYWGTVSATTFLGNSPTNFYNNGGDMVAYCFAAIPGYSAFGSYTGNGSTDGPFVFLGFRPAFVMRKRTDVVGSWIIQDDKRIGYNAAPTYLSVLYANETVAETINNEIDILSNGFKCRATESFGNASGGTYIWFALAENPFKYSLAR